MTIFKVNKNTEIVCDWKKTRNGFKHEATLLVNGREVDSTKINYLNRTWERFTYESVLEKLIDQTKILTGTKRKKFFEKASGEDRKRVKSEFNAIAMVATLGNIFGKDQKESNDWKARMLKAGLADKGLIMPEDWDTLSEDEKQRRLDGVIAELNK